MKIAADVFNFATSPEGVTQMENQQANFLLKEFEQLRIEINESVTESRSLERNAVLASGALWAWALVHVGDLDCASLIGLLSIPPIIAALSALRAYGLWRHVRSMCDYLIDLEGLFGPNLGWEGRFKRSKDIAKTVSAVMFWSILLSVTIVGIPLILRNLPPSTPDAG